MNRIEKYAFTNGNDDNVLTYITFLNSDGIHELYATGDVAQEISSEYGKGDEVECMMDFNEEIILGKRVAGRIRTL